MDLKFDFCVSNVQLDGFLQEIESFGLKSDEAKAHLTQIFQNMNESESIIVDLNELKLGNVKVLVKRMLEISFDGL